MAIWASAFAERIRAAVSNCGCVNYWNSLTRACHEVIERDANIMENPRVRILGEILARL